MELENKILAETYKIERKLSRGGMGAVYVASHTRLSRRFAIKVLQPQAVSDPEAFMRFEREARITSELGHPHIVDIIDFNITPEGVPYIVMELLDGEDLATRLSRIACFSLESTVGIISQTANALEATHKHEIIHRDLKPGNIFLCKRGKRDDFVKVLDFGVSKMLGAETPLTNPGTVFGTPWYMAPEQITGAPIDHRVDIFALGAVAYEMLTGRRPFRGQGIHAVLHKILNEDPEPLCLLRPDIPKAIENIVSICLRKKPEQRFVSVQEMQQGFKLAASGVVPEIEEYLEDTDPGTKEISQETLVVAPPIIDSLSLPEPVDSKKQTDKKVDAKVDSETETAVPLELPFLDEKSGIIVSKDEFHTTTVPKKSKTKLIVSISSTAVILAGLLIFFFFNSKEGSGPKDLQPLEPISIVSSQKPDLTLHKIPDAEVKIAELDHGIVNTPKKHETKLSHTKPITTQPKKAVLKHVVAMPKEPGLLTVTTIFDSKPQWAILYIDGKQIGETPIVNFEIKPGQYQIRVVQQGFKPKTERVLIKSGQTRKIVLDLEK